MTDEKELENFKITGQLRIEQYRSLRSEILETLKQNRLIKFWCIVAVSAYFGWLSTHCINFGFSIQVVPFLPWREIPWLIPLIIPLFGFRRTRDDTKEMNKIARYLRKIESQSREEGYSIGPGGGWETWSKSRAKCKSPQFPVLLWFIMGLFIICIATLVGTGHLDIPACSDRVQR